MSDVTILLALMRAYVDGDLLAKRALMDFLDETGDARLEAVKREQIDWLGVARRLCGIAEERKPPRRHAWEGLPNQPNGELARYRYYVDCARFGAGAIPEVVKAVTDARREWLAGLFPEVDLDSTSS
jgi:hypothetical protein